jgi:protein-S-isoprenylcysteine O-methyltransferase Ste14
MSLINGINAWFNHPGLRRFFVRMRTLLGVLALLAFLPLIPRSNWFWAGLAVSLAGAAAQAWCFACIMTSQELAVNGPYRFVRNPMYLARYVLILGVVLMLDPTRAWRWLLPAAFTIIYLFFMHNRVRREERKLAPLFGEVYQRYLREVPRFAPSCRPFPEGRTRFWNPAAFTRNHGARNLAAVITGHAVAYLAVYHLLPRLLGS